MSKNRNHKISLSTHCVYKGGRFYRSSNSVPMVSFIGYAKSGREVQNRYSRICKELSNHTSQSKIN